MVWITRKNLRNIKGISLNLLLLSCLLPSPVTAQLIRVQAVLDSNTIDLGGQVHLTLTVEKPSGSVVEFPVFTDTLCGSIEILTKGGIDSSQNQKDNTIILKQLLTLTAFDTGLLYIDPIPILYRSGNGVDTFRSAANYLEVLSFPVDTTNTIRDIKGLYKAPLTIREMLPWVLLAAALGLMAWFMVYYLKKKKRNEPVLARAIPIEAPDIIALRELENLKSEKVWQQGRVKEYYSRLSDIIRAYLEKRYNIMALEQTSYEILLTLQDYTGKDVNYDLLKALLRLSDLVKFAKAVPEPDENMNQLENAILFVRNTRPQPVSGTGEPDPHQTLKVPTLKPEV
jgi:hypothetical protein